MTKDVKRETRQIHCEEENRQASLFIEWTEKDGEKTLRSVSCDHPKLEELGTWECRWSCWKKIADEFDK